MIEAPSQITFDEYMASRDLNNFPVEQFAALERIEEFAQTISAAKQYINDLKENLKVETEHCNLIAHGVVSHLLTLVRNNERHLAFFLTPANPKIKDMNVLIDEKTNTTVNTLAHWEWLHILRNMDLVNEIAADIMRSPGQIRRIEGCMFSAKTHLLLSLANKILTYSINGIPYTKKHSFIFAGVNEDSIKTRVGGQGREVSIPQIFEEKAKRVYLPELIEDLSKIEAQPGTLIIVDEYTFLAKDEEQGLAFAECLNRLAEGGVTVLLGGLNNNFKNEPLAMSSALESAQDIYATFRNRANCTSYTIDPLTGLSTDSDTTIRHDVVVGFADMFFQVVIGREDGLGKVEYQTAPARANIFQSLKDNDPELYRKLNAIPEKKRVAAFKKRMEMEQMLQEA